MTSSVSTPQLPPLGLLHEAAEIGHGAKIGIDGAVVRNVVAVITAGRGIERQQPKRRDAEILQVLEFFGQPCEIADTVIVAVGKCLDMKLINDRVLEPKLVAFELRHRPDVSDHIHGTAFTSSIGTAGQDPANVFSHIIGRIFRSDASLSISVGSSLPVDDPQEREHYARLRDAWITLAKRCEPF